MEMDQYRLLQHQDHSHPQHQHPHPHQQLAGMSGFQYNSQNTNGLRPAMTTDAQFSINRNYTEEEILYDGPLGPRSMPRRSKRTIPDGEKDDRYWEKRKRNNEAAKRSRENKRKLDFEIRTRLGYLEEENALMRRELEILKTKLCIPVDQSVLSADEREEILANVEKINIKNSPRRDEIEIIPAPLIMQTMDLSKRRTLTTPIKQEIDEMGFMGTYMNSSLVWQNQQPMTSFNNDVKRSGQYDVRPYSVIQSPALMHNSQRMMTSSFDVYNAAQYHDQGQISPASISPVSTGNCSINAGGHRIASPQDKQVHLPQLRHDQLSMSVQNSCNKPHQHEMRVNHLTESDKAKMHEYDLNDSIE